MVTVLFTLDYEIHGNGEGCPLELMVEPTERIMKLFEQFGAKLTIMADVAEIFKYRDYWEEAGHDRFHFERIAEQLKDAVHRGHDVQLHLHSSYFNAIYDGRRWAQDWSEYSFANLPYARMSEMIEVGKRFLEDLLIPVRSDYRCLAFRAANWSVAPSSNVVRALAENGLKLDTSVFKYGHRAGIVSFDYAKAVSEFAPWKASDTDLCQADPAGKIWEVPICSESRWIGAFLTGARVRRVVKSRRHRVAQSAEGTESEQRPLKKLWQRAQTVMHRHAWKADFNQCTGKQLIHALQRVEAAAKGRPIPMVTIGHSKLFDEANDQSLRPFLAFIGGRPQQYQFGCFQDVLETVKAEDKQTAQ